jgi:hypothetical protein
MWFIALACDEAALVLAMIENAWGEQQIRSAPEIPDLFLRSARIRADCERADAKCAIVARQWDARVQPPWSSARSSAAAR